MIIDSKWPKQPTSAIKQGFGVIMVFNTLTSIIEGTFHLQTHLDFSGKRIIRILADFYKVL